MTAQEVYSDTVSLLTPAEQARLAALIVDNIQQADFQIARPDAYFSQSQISRLQELMQRTKENTLSETERMERDGLIEAELLASAHRTSALADAQGR